MTENEAYRRLNLFPGSSLADIKYAYRRLVARYHPDRNPGCPQAAETFQAVDTAYRLLSNRVGSNLSSESAVDKGEAPKREERRKKEASRGRESAHDGNRRQRNRDDEVELCRRQRRGDRSQRRFGWQLPDEYIGTHISREI